MNKMTISKASAYSQGAKTQRVGGRNEKDVVYPSPALNRPLSWDTSGPSLHGVIHAHGRVRADTNPILWDVEQVVIAK